MKRTDENRIVMFGTVAALFQDHQDLWSGIPALKETIGEVGSLREAIKSSAQRQGIVTTGLTENKESIRASLEDEMMDVADPLGALAARTNDADLGAQVEFSIWMAARWSAEKVLQVAERVLELGNARAGALAAYGLGADDLKELSSAVEAFRNARTEPRAATVARAVQTEALPGLVAATTALLRDQLDRQMTYFKRRNPEFFAAYRRARVIVDAGKGRKDEIAAAGAADPA